MISSHSDVGRIVLCQDNKSTICLANKGCSMSERTRHIKIRYFFIRHYIDANKIVIEYMPTDDMITDIMTKPLHGTTFRKLANVLSGNTEINV